MAVAFDANATADGHSTSSTTANCTTLTVGAGSNRALIAQISVDNASAPTINSVQWDATGTPQNMTLIGSLANGADARTYLYGLVAPTSGNKTLRVTFSANVAEAFINGTSFTGVDQTGGTTSFPHAATNSGTSTTPSVAITSAAGNMTVAAVTGAQTLSSPTQTQTYADNGGSFTSGGGSRANGAASVTHQWTLAGSVAWSMVGTDIAAAGGGSDVTVALTGQGATFTPGSAAPSTSAPLVGRVGTFATGTLAPSSAVALTGQAATFTPGTLTAAPQIGLVGQTAIFTPGALAPNTDAPLAGERGTFTPGTLAPLGDVTVALTGVMATFSTGVLTPSGGDTGQIGFGGGFGPQEFMPMSATIGRVRQEKRKKPPLPVAPIVEPAPVRAKPALPEPIVVPQPYVADLSERLLSTEVAVEDLARARRAQLADQEAIDALMLLLMTEA